jgi:hypothetical protein
MNRYRVWQDSHRLALIFGALLASRAAGFVINGLARSSIDLLGMAVLNAVAIVPLVYLGWVLHR